MSEIDHRINQRIFETSLDLILVVDSRGTFIRVSPSSLAILGYEAAELVGRSAREILYHEDLDSTREEMRAARYSDVMRNFECRYVHKSGRIVRLWWAGVWSAPEHQYFFIGRDISERADTERRVRESEARLALAVETAEIGLAAADNVSQPARIDAQFTRIYGLPPSRDSISVGDWLRLIHPDDRDEVAAAVLRAMRGSEGYRGEFRVRRADSGEERWVRAFARSAGDVDGRPGGFLGVNIDVTEQRRAEDRIRQAQKMEAIGNLTGGMAHDFNNVLGVIIGNLDLAREQLSGETNELVTDALEAAVSGAELTRRLLAFARRQPLRPARIVINDLLIGIVRLLRRTLGEDIEIVLDLDPDLALIVADAAQLEAAITNLATNARDAMPKGGKLSITTGNRELDAEYASRHFDVAPGGYAAIEVTDTGAGMPPEVVERIFEPFYTTKASGRGTGLGLSMVFGFLKQSGGHISVYSEPGVGTTFRLYFPHADVPADQAAKRPEAAARTGSGETVLAVEDNPALRRTVLRQLRQLGYRPLEADGPAAALAVLEREKVDLLFTDVVMPGGMDGIALAKQVMERWPGLRVILTSGFPGSKVEDQLGALPDSVRLLSKPYRNSDLARLLREALDG
jgi:PAS domain S-box-containing protein